MHPHSSQFMMSLNNFLYIKLRESMFELHSHGNLLYMVGELDVILLEIIDTGEFAN